MADQRILATENMIGANHPTLTDTLNRLTLVEHNTDGTHKVITGSPTSTLGATTVTTLNKLTVTAPASAATLTLADGSSLITSGAYAVTLTATGATAVTLPTSGTLATLAGNEALSNKTIAVTAGSVGSPSVAVGESSGLYRIGPNNIGLAVGGSKVLDIATTGLSVTGAINATNTTSSVFGQVSATNDIGNQIQMLAYGSARGGTGFGIAVANSSVLTDVSNTSTGMAIGTYYNKPLIFGTNNIEVFRCSTAQNVLIGTTTDAGTGKLQVTGNIAVTGDISVSTKTPANASATGTTGTITWDASYIYVCTATNTWKRVAIATW